MNARLDAGLPAAAPVSPSKPELRAWVIVHPFEENGVRRYRATRIEVREELLDLDLDSSMLASEESVVVDEKDDLERVLAKLGAATSALVDPRDCACPI